MTEAKVSSCLDLTSPGMRRVCFSRGRVRDLPRGGQEWPGGHLQVSLVVSEFQTATVARDPLCGSSLPRKDKAGKLLGAHAGDLAAPHQEKESQHPFVLRHSVQVAEAAPRFVGRSRTPTGCFPHSYAWLLSWSPGHAQHHCCQGSEVGPSKAKAGVESRSFF